MRVQAVYHGGSPQLNNPFLGGGGTPVEVSTKYAKLLQSDTLTPQTITADQIANGLFFQFAAVEGAVKEITIDVSGFEVGDWIDFFTGIGPVSELQYTTLNVSLSSGVLEDFEPITGKCGMVRLVKVQSAVWIAINDGINKEYIKQQTTALTSTNYSIPYGFDGNLTVNEVIAPVCGNGNFGTTVNTMGYPLAATVNFRIKGFSFAIQEFVTNGAGSIGVTLEYLVGDGTTLGTYNLGDGVFLDELILPLPDSLGGQRNYLMGSTDEIDILVPAGAILFASISDRTAQSANGLTMFVVGQLEEI